MDFKKNLLLLLMLFLYSNSTAEINKPIGLFASAPGNTEAFSNPEMRGVLIRAFWKDIEKIEGSYDFTALKNQLKNVKTYNKKWSLAISAGQNSPDWLISLYNIPYISFNFRGTTPIKVPIWWSGKTQSKLKNLAVALAKEFESDTNLALVYIPQMTANGIEGHFNGCPNDSLINAGYTEDKWVEAVETTARDYADAFKTKPIAVEVHNIMNSSKPAERIINDLSADTSLHNRVGLAMWWLSGRTNYQPELVEFIKNVKCDKYAQVIALSDSVNQFQNKDYKTVFSQAKELNIRYIEPWEKEFASHIYDSSFKDFNLWADSVFTVKKDTNHYNILGLLIYNQNPVNGTKWDYLDTTNGVYYVLCGALYKPEGNGPFPAIIINHGAYVNAFSFSDTLCKTMVKWGFVTIATNMCHSSGFPGNLPGTDKDGGASKANSLRIMKCRDILCSLKYVDTSKIGIFGHSRGAYATTGVLADYPDKFKFAGHTAGGVRDSSDTTDLTIPISSIVEKITAAYIIHHGEKDINVPIAGDNKLDSVLKDNKKDYKYYKYPTYDHNNIVLDTTQLSRTKAWFLEHLNGSTIHPDNVRDNDNLISFTAINGNIDLPNDMFETGQLKVSLIDLNGNELSELYNKVYCGEKINLPVNNFSRAVYFIKAVQKDKTRIFKLIKD